MLEPYLTEDNARIYETVRDRYDRFFPSEQHAIDTAVRAGDSVLDVGCNTGGLFVALKERHEDLRLHGIDPDPRSVAIARERHPEARIIEDLFPTGAIDGERFDAVFCLSLYTHFVNWKDKLAQLAAHSARALVVDVSLSDGPTVTDPDVSFTYYLQSGQRVPYVIVNTRQFVNFCFTELVGASDVEIVVRNARGTTGMPGVDPEQLLRGVAIIRRDDTGLPMFGGQQEALNAAYTETVGAHRMPKATVTVDGTLTSLYP